MLYLKLLVIELAPFDLNLNGNFCDEFYKYVIDIITNNKRIVSDFYHAFVIR